MSPGGYSDCLRQIILLLHCGYNDDIETKVACSNFHPLTACTYILEGLFIEYYISTLVKGFGYSDK